MTGGGVIIKALLTAWPFVREMLFGKKGATKVVSRNKTAAVSLFLNLLLTIAVFILIDLTLSLSKELTEHKANILTTNNEVQVQLLVMQKQLENTERELAFVKKENEILKTHISKLDPERRSDINDRLTRLRGGR